MTAEKHLPLWLTPPKSRDAVLAEVERLSGLLTDLQLAGINTDDFAMLDTSPMAACGAISEALMRDVEDLDLVYDWLWCAAGLGCWVSMAEIRRYVLDESDAPNARISHQDAEVLAATWATMENRANHRRTQLKRQREAKAKVENDARLDDVSMEDILQEDFRITPKQVPPVKTVRGSLVRRKSSDGVVAIPRVGDADSREGAALAKRFADVIGQLLPLVGHVPDPEPFADKFSKSFPWAGSLARYLVGQFALLRSSGAKWPKLPPLLLVGPSGCGKSTICDWLARELGLPSLTVVAGGASDSAGLNATSRGWSTATPAAPVLAMAENNVANVAVIVDEIEKSTTDSRNGSVSGALHAMLQPPSGGWMDTCLMATVDLSHITWMATANSLDGLPDSLVKRFLVMPVPAPGLEHFDAILPGVVSQEARRLDVDERMLPWIGRDDRAWLRGVFGRRLSIRDIQTAFRVWLGARAAEEAIAMARPN